MAKHDFFDHVVDGEIKQINIRRGGKFNGQTLGKNSPDSKYLEYGLYPVEGEQPVIDKETQTCTGPVHQWNEAEQRVDRIWTVTTIAIEDHQAEAHSSITAIAYERITSGIPFTIGGTEYTFKSDPSSLNMISTKAANFKSGITDPNSADPVEAFSGYWRTADNQNPVMTISEFYDLAKTCDLYVAGLAEREHVIKDTLIPAATTKGELDTIVSDYQAYDPLA